MRYSICAAPIGAAILSMAMATPGMAAYVDFDVFSYTGSVTAYDTLADAQSGVNGNAYQIPTRTVGSYSTLPNARDASLYADTDSDTFIFMTAWYFAAPGTNMGSGWGNPNNNNTGFVQLYDVDGSSLSSLAAG